MKKLYALSRYFGLFLLVILGSFLLWNCESQDEEFLDAGFQSGVSIEHLSLKEFQNELGNKTMLKKLEPNFKASNDDLHQKKGKISILTDEILKVTRNGITTYTFRLSKNTTGSSDFENLLVHVKSDKRYQLALTRFKYRKNTTALPYSVNYKKLNPNRLSDNQVLNNLFAKQLADGTVVDDCVAVTYACPYGSTRYHTSDQCGPDGSGPGSTTILNFDPCFNGSEPDRGGETLPDYPDSDPDDRDGGGNAGTGSGGVLEPPCDDSIHGCDKTDRQLINEFESYLQSIQNNLNWIPKTGIYKNRPSLSYTHRINLPNGDTQYLLSSEDQLLVSQSQRILNYSSNSIIATSEDNGPYHYLYSKQQGEWYELALDNYKTSCLSCDLEYLLKQASTTTLKLAGRYIVPIEDVLILIDGQDFDGADASRAIAASMILIEVVPGGKLLKPIVSVAKGNKSWKILTKSGTKRTILTSEEIFKKLKTEPNTAYFWSGRTSNGISVKNIALEIARRKGGTTLEGLLISKNINLPEYSENTKEIWNQVSFQYAKNASGEIKAVIGENLRLGNVWETIELPILKQNKDVVEIIVINPDTLTETTIFKR